MTTLTADVAPDVDADVDIEDLLPNYPSEPAVPNADLEDDDVEIGDDPAPVARAAKVATGIDRALVRRTAAKASELFDATDGQLKVLAHLLGANADPIDLTVAVITAPRNSTRAAADLFEVADADPMEAGLVVATLPKERSKALWSLLVALGEVKGTPPASDIKAALAIAKAAKKLSPAAAELLRSAVALGKRS